SKFRSEMIQKALYTHHPSAVNRVILGYDSAALGATLKCGVAPIRSPDPYPFPQADCVAFVISRRSREILSLRLAENARFLAPLGMTKLGLFALRHSLKRTRAKNSPRPFQRLP